MVWCQALGSNWNIGASKQQKNHFTQIEIYEMTNFCWTKNTYRTYTQDGQKWKAFMHNEELTVDRIAYAWRLFYTDIVVWWQAEVMQWKNSWLFVYFSTWRLFSFSDQSARLLTKALISIQVVLFDCKLTKIKLFLLHSKNLLNKIV